MFWFDFETSVYTSFEENFKDAFILIFVWTEISVEKWLIHLFLKNEGFYRYKI